MSQVKLDAISMQGLIKLSRQQGTQLNALDACEQWIVGADREITRLRQRVEELEQALRDIWEASCEDGFSTSLPISAQHLINAAIDAVREDSE